MNIATVSEIFLMIDKVVSSNKPWHILITVKSDDGMDLFAYRNGVDNQEVRDVWIDENQVDKPREK